MSATQSTTAEDTDGATGLAKGLQTDEPEDTRSCPHECHGSLSLTDENTVICESCRCTPDGHYLPPDDGETAAEEVPATVIYPSYPHPQRSHERHQTWEHSGYESSERIRQAGGYEQVYDTDEDNRPNGVGEAYTFPLDSMSYERV